jgi:hypothetical protein
MTIHCHRLLLVTCVGILAPLAGCSARAPAVPLTVVPATLVPPVSRQPVDLQRAASETLVRTDTVTDEHDLIIGIDVILDSGGLDNELPPDLGLYAAGVFDGDDSRFALLDGSVDDFEHCEHRISVPFLTLGFNRGIPRRVPVRGTTAASCTAVDQRERSSSTTLYIAASGRGHDTTRTDVHARGDGYSTVSCKSVGLGLSNYATASFDGIAFALTPCLAAASVTTMAGNGVGLAIGHGAVARLRGIAAPHASVSDPRTNSGAVALGNDATASIGGVDVEIGWINRTPVDVTTSVNSVALAIGSGADAHIGGILIK